MKHTDGRKLPSYNHQRATNGKYGVICAVATRNEVDRSADLFYLVHQARGNTGQAYEVVMADPASRHGLPAMCSTRQMHQG